MKFTIIDNAGGDIAYSRELKPSDSVNDFSKLAREAGIMMDCEFELDAPGARIPNGTHTLYLHDESHDIFAGIAWSSIEAYAEYAD